MVFSKRLVSRDHTRLFVIEPSDRLGWDIREEQDSRVIRSTHCTDWHHVERMRAVFEWQVLALEEAGWIEP